MRPGYARLGLVAALCLLVVGCGEPHGPTAEDMKPAKPVVTEPKETRPEEEQASKTKPAPSAKAEPVPPPKVEETPVETPWVEMKHLYSRLIFNPDAGDLLSVNSNAGTAQLYPRGYLEGTSDKSIGPAKLPGNSIGVYKRYKDRSYFVIVQTNSGVVRILDAGTLEAVQPLMMPSGRVRDVRAARNPDDPCVYAAFGDAGTIVTINLKTMRVEKTDLPSAPRFVVSPDGKRVYTLSRSTLTVFDRRESVQGAVTWQRSRGVHARTDHARAGPKGEYVYTGIQIWSADLSHRVREAPARPDCIFAARPLFLNAADDDLVAVSLNTLQVIGKVKLPKGFRIQPTPDPTPASLRRSRTSRFMSTRPPRLYAVKLIADETRRRVVAVAGPRVLLMPLKEMGLPEEPWLLADIKMPATVFVGEKISIPVTLKDERTRIDLPGAPEGMRVAGNAIEWTPRGPQVGSFDVNLRLHQDDFERLASVRTQVSQPFVRLAFSPDGIDTSPGGRYAVLWTKGRKRGGKADKFSWLALVDIERGKLVAQKEILYTLFDAAVGDEHVYVAPSHSNRVNVLSIKDLSTETFTNLDFRPESLTVLSPEVLVVSLGTSRSGYRYCSLGDLSPVATVAALWKKQQDLRNWRWVYVQGLFPGRTTSRDRTRKCALIRDGFHAEGCVWGKQMDLPRMLISMRDIPLLPVDRPRELTPPLVWDRTIAGDVLRDGRGREVHKLPAGRSHVMHGLPVAVTLRTGYADSQASATLLLNDLVSGETRRRIPLIQKQPTSRQFKYSTVFTGKGGRLAASGRRILALLGDRLFIQTIDEDAAKDFPEPFHFKLPEKLIFLDPKGPNTIPHRTVGGKAPLEFDLSITRKGVTINHKTGALMLDGPALTSASVDFLVEKFKNDVRVRPPDRKRKYVMVGPGARLAYLQEVTRAPFLWATGREPKGIPLLLPVGIVAADARGQTARLDYQVLIEVSADRVLEAIRKLKGEPLDRDTPPAACSPDSPANHALERS